MPNRLLETAARRRRHTALESPSESVTYGQLSDDSSRAAARLLSGKRDLGEARIAFLVPPSPDYVRTQWGIWRAGAVAVPLCTVHPEPELDYVIGDAGVEILVVSPALRQRLAGIAERRRLPLLTTADLLAGRTAAELPPIGADRRALIVYTSGTTGQPKGAVLRHGNLEAQAASLHAAWGWTESDRILEVLPLHHVHGIVNVVYCALFAGATCRLHESFDATAVWRSFRDDRLTLFMAVPTIYNRLIAAYDAAAAEEQQAMRDACDSFRLMVSGSAALPVSVLERWRQISGQVLLERYGMTETGMILSNPLDGERRPGWVGAPLPGVTVRMVDDEGEVVEGPGQGSVEVRGAGVFREYWRRPEETAASFDGDWFSTGDAVEHDGESYRILGRQSVDILKTGGYKVSALEIEETLRRHGGVADCAVVGIEDETWGERICAAVILTSGASLGGEDLRQWLHTLLAPYKVPKQVIFVADLPRNALGKVQKPAVKDLFPARSDRA